MTVHGNAEPVEFTDERGAQFKRTLLGIYVPRYGSRWQEFMENSRYIRVVAERMFAFSARSV